MRILFSFFGAITCEELLYGQKNITDPSPVGWGGILISCRSNTLQLAALIESGTS